MLNNIPTCDHIICFQQHDASTSLSVSFGALPFSQCCVWGKSEHGGKQTYHLCAQRPTTHIFGFFIHATGIDGTVTITTFLSTSALATTLEVDYPHSLLNRNDHVWSCCGYTCLYSMIRFETHFTDTCSLRVSCRKVGEPLMRRRNSSTSCLLSRRTSSRTEWQARFGHGSLISAFEGQDQDVTER